MDLTWTFSMLDRFGSCYMGMCVKLFKILLLTSKTAGKWIPWEKHGKTNIDVERPFVDREIMGFSTSTLVSPGSQRCSHAPGAGAASGCLASAHPFLVSSARGLRGRDGDSTPRRDGDHLTVKICPFFSRGKTWVVQICPYCKPFARHLKEGMGNQPISGGKSSSNLRTCARNYVIDCYLGGWQPNQRSLEYHGTYWYQMG